MLDHGFNVVFAGNVGSAQAVDVIVEAAKALRNQPEVRFVVIGQGSRHAWMEREVQRQGLKNLHLPGQFPVEMMPTVMRKAGALLVTLTDAPIFSRTVPNKVQAYLASGRPIIACINGEGARIVEEAGAGITLAALDVQGLVQAVLQLLKMPQLDRDAMGARGRAYFLNNFEHEKLVGELIAILKETVILKGRSA
jgi:glycosyltransferase involved in cell wall biosynthesis